MYAQKPSHYRVFGGKRYTFDRSFKTKSKAFAYAKAVRKNRDQKRKLLARVVKGNGNWLVYGAIGEYWNY